MMKKAILTLAISLLLTKTVMAYPVLQLYIDGSVYDPETETWVITDPTFDLWVIGDVGRVGTIYDVKLALAFFGEGGSVTITPKTTTRLTDPSTPPAPFVYSSGTGSNPPLPDHGIYNDPSLNSWTNYYLGDFDLTDSPVGDFMTGFPATFDSTGQINVYEVTVTGWKRVHFDAMDHTVMTVGKTGKEKTFYWMAPFSHDAQQVVPEPSTLLLLGSSFLGVMALKRRRFFP